MNLKKIINTLQEKDLTISTIESLTGGGVAYFFTKQAGASSVFKKALVTYSNEAKIDAGVNRDILNQFGAVSKEVAYEMLNCMDTDIVISLTGNAGPTAMDNKPVGLVFIGIKIKDEIEIIECNFEGDREEIRNSSIEQALNILEKNIQNLKF